MNFHRGITGLKFWKLWLLSILGWVLFGTVKVWAEISTEIEMNSSQYLDSSEYYFPSYANSSNESFMLRSSGEKSGKSGWKASWDAETEYSASENWNYFRPHEGYVSYQEFSLGRKKITWSQWEEPWGQTMVQPRFTDDRLHNSQAGLIGAFYDHEGKYFNVHLVFSPIYIPEMGPHYWLADQHFTSRNPWFHAPTTNVDFAGQETNLNYSVNQPDDWTVMNRPGGGGTFEWRPSDHTFARVSEAFLPITQIMFGFPLNGQFSLQSDSMDINLTPRFLYHNVVNSDFVVQNKQSEVGVSLSDDLPIQDQLPVAENWELQRTTNAIIASAYYTQYFTDSRASSFTASALKIWGGDQPDQGQIISTQTLFGRRYDFTEAVSARLHKRWMAGSTVSIDGGLRVLYDYFENGLIYSGEVSSQLSKSFAVRLAYDFFGLLPGNPEMPDGFIDVYRGNDRVSMGMSYVF